MNDPRLRQITIKTGVVKRIAKERSVCDKEAEIERKRLSRFESEGRDSHDLRKQEEVIQEALMMIPETQKR